MRPADFYAPHIFDLVTKALKFCRAANIVNISAAKRLGLNGPFN